MHRIAKLLFSTTAALGGAYGVAVATKVAPTYRYKVTASSQNPKDFDTSYSVTKHGNPRGNVAFTHSVSVTLWIPERRHGREAGGATLTDEPMLVRMLKGYYGGWVIAPERWAFAAVGADIVDFEGVPKPKNVTWSPSRSLRETLPPRHHILIGAFQILDAHIVGSKSNNEGDDSSDPPLLGLEGMHAAAALASAGDWSHRTSYVDLGFGDNKGTFSGINRFAVTTLEPDDAEADKTVVGGGQQGGREGEPGRLVRFTLSAVACNPCQNAITTSRWVFELHKVYANFLFREAVSRVLADC